MSFNSLSKVTASIVSIFPNWLKLKTKGLLGDALGQAPSYEEQKKFYMKKGFTEVMAKELAEVQCLKYQVDKKNKEDEALAKEAAHQRELEYTRENKKRYAEHVLSAEKMTTYIQEFNKIHAFLKKTSPILIDNDGYQRQILTVPVQLDELCHIQLFVSRPNYTSSEFGSRKDVPYGFYVSGSRFKFDYALVRKIYDTRGLFPQDYCKTARVLDKNVDVRGTCLDNDGHICVITREYTADSGVAKSSRLWPEDILMFLIMEGSLSFEKIEQGVQEAILTRQKELALNLK